MTYNLNDKIHKLFRQIYWRIHENYIINNIKKCYYIVGLEDSGKPSYISIDELIESLNLIKKYVKGFNLNFKYLFLKNTIENYNIIVIRFWTDDGLDNIEYF